RSGRENAREAGAADRSRGPSRAARRGRSRAYPHRRDGNVVSASETARGDHGRRLARSTAIFSLATGLSRILGLVREIVARYYFGTVGAINAFEVAFLIPNTLRALVADAALSSAFVPVFSDLLEKGERKRAW